VRVSKYSIGESPVGAAKRRLQLDRIVLFRIDPPQLQAACRKQKSASSGSGMKR
jgi:hypothetical protein